MALPGGLEAGSTGPREDGDQSCHREGGQSCSVDMDCDLDEGVEGRLL